MDKILNFIHGLFLWSFTLITLFFIDLPLKIILCALILVLGLVAALLYPLVKKIEFPGWFYVIYDYATTKKYLLARSVYKLWQ